MFEVFESEASKRKKNHLKNLVSLAKLDGKVTSEEFQFLIKVGEKNAVSKADLEKMLSKSGSITVKKPENDDERFEVIYELIEMVLADHVMDENELDFVIELAHKLGFRPAICGLLTRKIALDIIQKQSKEVIKEKVTNFLKINS